jgi:hypothetical protein
MKPLLIDIGPLCDCGADHALEELHKALADPSGDDGVWRPHESAVIRDLIEKVTSKGIEQLDGLKEDLMHWLHRSKFGAPAQKPSIPRGMIRWTPGEVEAAQAYLSGVPKEYWAVTDYELLVEFLVQKYLPPDFAFTQADWMAHRAYLMGKVQAVMRDVTPGVAETMLQIWEDQKRLESAMRAAGMNQAILDYGTARCADLIVGLTEKTRHAMKRVIMGYESARRLGDPVSNSSLQQALMDEFSDLNRDWRRIALTEVGEMANQGFVSSFAPGQKIKRIEQYQDACPFCKKWNNAVLTVVDPAKKDKDWDTEVWAGKTNVGRSASPYKRVGGMLVPRLDAERWKPAAGTFHPHCRGSWVALGTGPVADDFSLWLDGFLADQKAKNAQSPASP